MAGSLVAARDGMGTTRLRAPPRAADAPRRPIGGGRRDRRRGRRSSRTNRTTCWSSTRVATVRCVTAPAARCRRSRLLVPNIAGRARDRRSHRPTRSPCRHRSSRIPRRHVESISATATSPAVASGRASRCSRRTAEMTTVARLLAKLVTDRLDGNVASDAEGALPQLALAVRSVDPLLAHWATAPRTSITDRVTRVTGSTARAPLGGGRAACAPASDRPRPDPATASGMPGTT